LLESSTKRATYLKVDDDSDRQITLREANQGFARLVREAEGGTAFTITRRGVPVARLTPVDGRARRTPEQEAAAARILARLRHGWPIGAGPLDRDAIHDR
jgi:prevent-host-death family protein